MAKQKIDWKIVILDVLKKARETDIHRVARAAGKREPNAADRRAIQRAFKSLIERQIIRAQGSARARLYLTVEESQKHSSEEEALSGEFRSIPLSKSSDIL